MAKLLKGNVKKENIPRLLSNPNESFDPLIGKITCVLSYPVDQKSLTDQLVHVSMEKVKDLAVIFNISGNKKLELLFKLLKL